jgi:putative addiction module component (TIGR02574 family)
MVATLELKSLSIPERLLLVEDIWDSIEEEQHALADHPSVIGEVRARKNKFISNPSSGISWEDAKERIRNGLA